MTSENARPLTPEEREELEALRAEKARREAEVAAERDRAELAALRAEQEAVDAQILAERARAAERAGATAPAPAPAPARPEPQAKPARERTFGQKMVLAPETTDPDEIPGMAPAQKIIIGLAVVALIVFVICTVTH